MPTLALENDLVGGWCHLPTPATAEILGLAGFDFVCIDTQHGLMGPDLLLPMLQAVDASGTPSLVRVTHNSPELIGAALDRAAAGVIVPLVDSAAQAAAAVAACHHPPRGTRSYGPTRVNWRPGETVEPLCIVMVETPEAVEAVDAIAAVDGVDAVFVGPSDLALTTGMPVTAQHGDPAYDRLLGHIVSRCRAAGKPVGIFSASPAHVQRYRGLGFSFFALMSDAALLRAAAAENLKSARP
jgi:4-hydroxy-2-oxoheptanedioate aldolase